MLNFLFVFLFVGYGMSFSGDLRPVTGFLTGMGDLGLTVPVCRCPGGGTVLTSIEKRNSVAILFKTNNRQQMPIRGDGHSQHFKNPFHTILRKSKTR